MMRKGFRPELTAEMHAEFLEGEMSFDDVMVMKVYCLLDDGMSKEQACREAHISVEYYDENVERVLRS